MLGFLGKMFGSDKAITKTVDTVAGAFDALHYSEEEKAEAKTRAFDQVVNWMEATQGQNLTRRFIAVSVTLTWLVQIIIAQVMLAMMPWVDDKPVLNAAGEVVSKSTADKLMQSAQVMQNGAENMTGAVMLVFGFYFAARHIDKIAGVALTRFGNKN